jgi:hypothetical protein
MRDGRVLRWAAAGLALGVGWEGRAGDRPDLAVSLGARNEGVGLVVPSGAALYSRFRLSHSGTARTTAPTSGLGRATCPCGASN